MTLWERLEHARRRKGLTQKQFCDEFGWGRTRISKLISGESKLDTDELIALTRRLGIRDWWLFDPAAPIEEPPTELTDAEAVLIAYVRSSGISPADAVRRLARPEVLPVEAAVSPVPRETGEAAPRRARKPGRE